MKVEVIKFEGFDIKVAELKDGFRYAAYKEGTTNQYSSKINIVFYPWVPLSAEKRVPCSADWVITMVEPIENLKKLYQEKLDGRDKGNQSPVIV